MATDYTSSDRPTTDYTASTNFSSDPAHIPAVGGPRRLTRATDEAMIGGVCAGIARRFGWDTTLVRVLFVLSCLLPGPQVLAYLAMWVLIPADD